MSATLRNYWLTKSYPVDGRIFTFVWGVTALDMDDAFRIVKTPIVKNLTKGSVRWKWYFLDGECFLEERSDQPEIKGDNFSVRDDRIKRRMPAQLSFNL